MNEKISYIMKKYNLSSRDKLEQAMRMLENREVYFFGVSGKMGSGKDTCAEGVAKYIQNNHNTGDFVNYSFSTPLRKEVDVLSNMDPNDLGEYADFTDKNDVIKLQEILNGKSVYKRSNETRLALQYWGTDIRRSQDENWWVSKTGDAVVDMLANGVNICISDARHKNEAEFVEALSLGLIRLNVSDDIRKIRLLKRDGQLPEKKTFYHLSETDLDDYPFKKEVNAEKPIDEVINESIKLLDL